MPLRHLLLGMSHVHAPQRALTEAEAQWFRVVDLNAERLDQARTMAERLALRWKFGAVDVLCLCLGGNAHNVIGLMNHPQPFWMVPGPQNGQLVPLDMMRRHIQVEYDRFMTMAESLIQIFPDARRVMVAAPPPFGDTDHIRRHPGIFRDKLRLGFSPDAHRLRLYAMQCAVQKAQADAIGADYVTPPPEAVDDRGFLRRDYFNADPTHGNTAYGRLLLDRILSLSGEGVR